MDQKNLSAMHKKTFLTFSGILLMVSIDQIIKHKIRQNGGFYVCNEGMALGIPYSGLFFWLVLGILLFIFSASFYYLAKKGLLKPLHILAFVFLLGGSLSNIIDRLFSGCIFDYISFLNNNLLVFNLADIAIFMGSSVLILIIYKKNTDNS